MSRSESGRDSPEVLALLALLRLVERDRIESDEVALHMLLPLEVEQAERGEGA